MPLIVNRSFMEIIYISAFILTSVCFFVLGLSSLFSNQIINFGHLLMDSTREIKYEITRSHLMIDNILSSGSSEEIGLIGQHLDSADENIQNLIRSLKNFSGWFTLFNGAEFQQDINKACSDLEQLMTNSRKKYSYFSSTRHKKDEEKNYDAYLISFIYQLNLIEMRFQSILKSRFYGLRKIQYASMVVILFLIFTMAIYTGANFKFRFKMEKKLSKISEIFFCDMKEKEAKLKSILKLAPIGIGITTNDIFQQVNDHMEMMSGYTKKELEGQTSRVLYASSKEFDRVRKIKHEEINHSGTAVVETFWRRKDGSIINVLYNATPQDKKDIKKGTIFTALDITSWKKTQIQLKTSEEKYRLLAENTVDCIWLMDLNLIFRYVNPSVFHMLGFTPEEWVGTRLEDHFPRHEIEKMGSVIEEELMRGANGKGVLFETNIFNKQSKLIPVEITGKILFDSSHQPVCLQGITRDISRRKKAEDEVKRLNQDLEQRVAERTAQLNAVNKELESFAFSVSHDLRAPLRSIGGFSKILFEDYFEVLDESGRDYLSRVQRNTDHMEKLIDNMLKFSRTMRCEMKKEHLDLSAMAHIIIEELRTQEKGRDVKVIIAPNIFAQGDSHLIRAVLDNLIGNAWKFTSRKKEAARIEFGMSNENGCTVYFVKDNGVGFDMACSDKLFTVFKRLHTGAEFPGSGVGLATVDRIIQRHGGRIWAEGKQKQGAVFYFTL